MDQGHVVLLCDINVIVVVLLILAILLSYCSGRYRRRSSYFTWQKTKVGCYNQISSLVYIWNYILLSRLLGIYKRIHGFVELSRYFLRQFAFSYANVPRLWAKLDENDRSVFPFNMEELNWTEMIIHSAIGFRRYLVKDDPSTIPDALRRMKKWIIYKYNEMVPKTIFFQIEVYALYTNLWIIYNWIVCAVQIAVILVSFVKCIL